MGQDKILILGAGPAGMACAMELHKADKQFTIVEKDEQVGGLSKTYQLGDFRTDNGPHRFFSQNKYLYDFIEDLLGEKWITVDRCTRFYIDGKFYQYPVEWKDALSNMGLFKAGWAFLDYLAARIRFLNKESDNFEDFAVSNFGRTLAEFNMLNYTEKIWGLPCTQLSVAWAQQRIKGLTLRSLLANAILKKSGPKTLVDQFYYPNLGTGLIYEAIKDRISEQNPVLLSNEPVRFEHNGSRLKKVTLKNGETFTDPKSVISSIPMTSLLDMLDPAPPAPVSEAMANLKYRSQAYLFLTLNKPTISKDQWIYFPDREVPFGRISEMRNFSELMSPKGKTSLFVEFFCWKDDEIWNMTKEDLFELAIAWLDKLEFVNREEVIDIYHIRKENAYPVYDLDYKKNLDTVKEFLDGIENLIYIGRPGRFKYTNQDHSLEMGILAARSIIDGKKYNIEDVGAEEEYFERGYAKSS